jgi:galactoside O-acetyltransferase
MIGYYNETELLGFGFLSLGTDVRISRTSTLYNCHTISIGSHVRIDNFCTIALSGSARLTIGNYVHISAYNFINGAADMAIGSFVTTAPFVKIFSSSDDYSGMHMTGGVVPRELIGTISKQVSVEDHCIIGVSSTIMPGVTLGMGTAVGAHSFITQSSGALDVVAGVPGKRIGRRNDDFLTLAAKITG